MADSIERKHLYKVFRDGIYLGLLPNPVSEFGYRQDLNTAGTQLQIDIAQTIDTSSEAVEPIETELSEIITTENEQIITTETATPIVGNKDSGLLIANGNDIEVWEYSETYPNGVLVFTGYQSRMRGSVGKDDNIRLYVMSYGKDLDDYIFGNSSHVLQLSQLLSGDNFGFWSTLRYGQTFITGAAQTDITRITLSLFTFTSRTFTVRLWPSPAAATIGGTPLASASVVVNTGGVFSEQTFDFGSAIPVSPSTQYLISLEIDAGAIFPDSNTWGGFLSSGTGAYAGGTLMESNFGGEWSDAFYTDDDMYFKIYSGTILTNASFSGYDPSDMVTDALDGYQLQGGIVTYTGSSIDATGYSLDYEFIMATVLEIVKKARELAPANWYWYVDPATQVLYFKETATTATHKFILGRHIQDLRYEATIEYIKNVVYFTGGPTGGVNLLRLYTDAASLAVNRVGMERMNDNRIVAANEPSAASIANSFMEENSGEVFTADPLVIHADSYDITTVKLGDTVGFAGFGTFIEDIIFQITAIDRGTDSIEITLGRLPLRSSAFVDDIKRRLDNEQTLDNPNTPS